jgi:small subunit ribosomal protein S16
MGRKKKPFYRIVAIDSRVRRDGRYLENLGYYDPLANPAVIKIDKGKVLAWLEKGAIPSETVFNLLQKQGIALEWHLLKNKVSPQAADIELQKWAMMKNVPVSKIEPAGKATDEAEPQSAPEKEINLQNQANSDTGDTPSASSISE